MNLNTHDDDSHGYHRVATGRWKNKGKPFKHSCSHNAVDNKPRNGFLKNKELIGDEVFDLTVSSAKVGSYHVDIAVEEGADKVLIETHDVEQVSPDVSISFNVNNQIIKSLAVIDSNVLYHALQSADTAIFLSSINQLVVTDDGADGSAGGLVTAPLHGRVIDVFVKVGDKVAEGQKLAIVEAMKMQHEIFSEVEGIAVDVRIVSDQQVSVNDLMIEIVEENVGDEENA